MLGATVPLIEGDEKPLGFGGGKKINTSNSAIYLITLFPRLNKVLRLGYWGTPAFLLVSSQL